jgi:hypothetical protein
MEDCPVCLETKELEKLENCTHKVCATCLKTLSFWDRRCPVCRADFSELSDPYAPTNAADEVRLYVTRMPQKYKTLNTPQPLTGQVMSDALWIIEHALIRTNDYEEFRNGRHSQKIVPIVIGFWLRFAELNLLLAQNEYFLPGRWNTIKLPPGHDDFTAEIVDMFGHRKLYTLAELVQRTIEELESHFEMGEQLLNIHSLI